MAPRARRNLRFMHALIDRTFSAVASASLDLAPRRFGRVVACDGGLIEVSVIVTEDKLVSRSLYTTMDSLTGSDDAQMKLMGAMKEHFAGAPGRTTGMVDWTFAGTAAKPSGKKFVTEHVEPFWFSRLLVDSPGTCTRPAHTGTE